MFKIKLSQYERRFENLYKKELLNELSLLEDHINTNIYKRSLSKDKFYFSKPTMTIYNENNVLVVNVEDNNYKQLYLSYETLNNTFNIPPDESLVDLNKYQKYLFNIEIESTENINVIPYVIHYKNSKKLKLTSLKQNHQTLDFKEDDQCRLTFKIIGHGNFEIKTISIIPKGWSNYEWKSLSNKKEFEKLKQ